MGPTQAPSDQRRNQAQMGCIGLSNTVLTDNDQRILLSCT